MSFRWENYNYNGWLVGWDSWMPALAQGGVLAQDPDSGDQRSFIVTPIHLDLQITTKGTKRKKHDEIKCEMCPAPRYVKQLEEYSRWDLECSSQWKRPSLAHYLCREKKNTNCTLNPWSDDLTLARSEFYIKLWVPVWWVNDLVEWFRREKKARIIRLISLIW